MKSYSVKCRKNTEKLNSKIFKTKMVNYLCSENVPTVELKSEDIKRTRSKRFIK